MRIIPLDNPHRKKHFDFFNRMDQPHFNLVANIDITHLLPFLKAHSLSFTPAIVYLIAKTANEIPHFRRRIRGGQIVEHEVVHPSFTVTTDVSEVFSFCTVEFDHDPTLFMDRAVATMERMKQEPDFEDEEGRDDFLFLSSIPWVSFTGLSHAMHYHPVDSVPRITWGKYFEQGQRILMPLAVQAHHAVVDGWDMGKYFQQIQAFADDPNTTFLQKS